MYVHTNEMQWMFDFGIFFYDFSLALSDRNAHILSQN